METCKRQWGFLDVIGPEFQIIENELAQEFDGNIGVELLNYIRKVGVTKGYCERVPRPAPPGATSVDCVNKAAFEDIASSWNYITQNSIERPVFSDRLWRKLVDVRFQDKELLFFSPWGCRQYNQNFALAENLERLADLPEEKKTLKEIEQTLNFFREKRFNTKLLLMPADVYGTKINRWPQEYVKTYFALLKSTAKQIICSPADFILWSEIIADNREEYDAFRDDISVNIFRFVKYGEFLNACKAAGKFNNCNSSESAKEYCIERIVEAEIIKQKYAPVKLSLVRKEKDNLDKELTRVYLIKNKSPWLR